MGKSTLRCFICLDLPSSAKKVLARAQRSAKGLFKANGVRASWSDPAGMHLTLSFLGDIRFVQLPDIKQALSETAEKSRVFDLCLGRIGTFPHSDRPKIVWMGIEGDIGSLKCMQGRLQTALCNKGVALKKQRFHPHITIARIKHTCAGGILALSNIHAQADDSSGFQIQGIHLYESQLQPGGAVHTRLATATLEKATRPDQFWR